MVNAYGEIMETTQHWWTILSSNNDVSYLYPLELISTIKTSFTGLVSSVEISF